MESQNKRNRILIARWVLYTLVLLVAAALQTTPGFLCIGECKPFWILGVCIAVSAQENEFSGALFGALGGMLWDFTSGRTIGFFAIGMLFLCFFCSVLVQLYLKKAYANIFLLNVLAGLLVTGMDFLFGYWMRGFPEPMRVYTTIILPEVLISAVLALFSMWLIHVIASWLSLP